MSAEDRLIKSFYTGFWSLLVVYIVFFDTYCHYDFM